jgi:hypothetical protein
MVWATVPGRLLEVNSRLAADGSLLFTRQARAKRPHCKYKSLCEQNRLDDVPPVRPVCERDFQADPSVTCTRCCPCCRPCREGYLAIVLPTNAETRQLQQDLVPVDKYLELRGLAAQDIW